MVQLGKKLSLHQGNVLRNGSLRYTIHMGKPFISWCIISLGNRIYHLHKGVPVTEKWPQKPEIGIKDGFEEM